MPKIYKCEKCNKYFNKKDHLITHINRKFPCVNPNNISCYTIKDAVEINEDLPSSFFTNEVNENLPLKPPKKPQVIKQNEIPAEGTNEDIAEIPDIALKEPVIALEEPIIALKNPENPDIAENVTEKIPLQAVLNDAKKEHKNKLTIGDEYDDNKVNINVENLDLIKTLKTELKIEPKTELKTEHITELKIEPKTELKIEPKTEFSSVAKETEQNEKELKKTELKKTELETELSCVIPKPKEEDKKANYGDLNEINTKIKRRLFSKKDIDDVLNVTKYNNNKTDLTITDTPFILDNICDITPPTPIPKQLQTKSVFINDGNDAINFDEFTKSKMYMTDLANIKKYGKKKSVKNYRPRHNLTPRTQLRNLKNKTKEPLSVAETRPKTKKQNIMNITKL
jgi:hypothetical protein